MTFYTSSLFIHANILYIRVRGIIVIQIAKICFDWQNNQQYDTTEMNFGNLLVIQILHQMGWLNSAAQLILLESNKIFVHSNPASNLQVPEQVKTTACVCGSHKITVGQICKYAQIVNHRIRSKCVFLVFCSIFDSAKHIIGFREI
jgi:hypothetical protein